MAVTIVRMVAAIITNNVEIAGMMIGIAVTTGIVIIDAIDVPIISISISIDINVASFAVRHSGGI